MNPAAQPPQEVISIRVNGASQDVAAGMTVAQWVEAQGLHPQQVAVEVNEELVARAERESVTLQAGDRVETVTLVGGG